MWSSTTLPNTSPDVSRSNAARTSEKACSESMIGRIPRPRTGPRARPARRGVPMVEPMISSCRKNTRRRSTVARWPDGRPADHDRGRPARRLQRVLEGRRADRLDHHVDPFRQPRAGLERGRAERRDPLPLVRRRGWSRRPVAPSATASSTAAVATPPPAPCTSTEPPSGRPARGSAASGTRSATPSAGRPPRRTRVPAGFGTRLRRGTADPLGERARLVLGEQRALRVHGLVGRVGSASRR